MNKTKNVMDNPSAQIKINICSTSCSYHVILLGPHIVKSNINRIHPMQIMELITIPCWKFNSIQINDNCCFVQLICYCLHVQIYDPIFMCLGLCRKAKVQSGMLRYSGLLNKGIAYIFHCRSTLQREI